MSVHQKTQSILTKNLWFFKQKCQELRSYQFFTNIQCVVFHILANHQKTQSRTTHQSMVSMLTGYMTINAKHETFKTNTPCGGSPKDRVKAYKHKSGFSNRIFQGLRSKW